MMGELPAVTIFYITSTIHYIDEMRNLQSHLLDIAEMSVDHIAINLADELQESIYMFSKMPSTCRVSK